MDKLQVQAARVMTWRDHLARHAASGKWQVARALPHFAGRRVFHKPTFTHGGRNCGAVWLVLPLRRQTLPLSISVRCPDPLLIRVLRRCPRQQRRRRRRRPRLTRSPIQASNYVSISVAAWC